MKRMLVLKLPTFFPCRVGEGEKAAISKQTSFSQKRVRSYIVLALEELIKLRIKNTIVVSIFMMYPVFSFIAAIFRVSFLTFFLTKESALS